MRKVLFFLLLASMAINVQAQQITGQIIDDLTGDSIPFAALRYRGHKTHFCTQYIFF